MRIFLDTADLEHIVDYVDDPAISGFTTNATLIKRARTDPNWLVKAAGDKEISVELNSCADAPNIRWKVTDPDAMLAIGSSQKFNLTAICSPGQVPRKMRPDSIISVFAGRIMDTGRSPANIITLAKASGAQVLWASSRSVYDITLAAIHGCDIITVTPAIYEKYKEWNGMELTEVAARTIAQFEADRVG